LEEQQIIKLLIVLFPTESCYFLYSNTKYCPQNPVDKHPQSMFFP